jgi:hypothetical protein
VAQTNGVLTAIDATSAATITISPISISNSVATGVTFTSSGNGDKFSWSTAGAANCNGVAPSTLITLANEVVSVSLPSNGAHKLCYSASGGSDSVVQTNGDVTVVTATSGTAVTISPASSSNGVAADVTFTDVCQDGLPLPRCHACSRSAPGERHLHHLEKAIYFVVDSLFK